jgi:hypothetical protein
MLKYSYSQWEDVIHSAGGTFTHMSLSAANRKSNTVINGPAIFNMAQLVLKQGKKAIAVELVNCHLVGMMTPWISIS